MSVIPSGVSVQEIYRRFRENQIVVNRKYQRKLVWSESEKACLINSISKGYPIPLILFAEYAEKGGKTYYEVLDGMQRLNAIVGFIENEYPVEGKYFDIKQLARAQQAEADGLFVGYHGANLHEPTACANVLDYQLAVTSYKVESEQNVFEIFRRINSSGRQLSSQEQRQAGVICPFSDLVREISADIRGDSTNEQLFLSDMPQISIGNSRENSKYGLEADKIFWIKQGILDVQDLKNSDDEEIIADILISILLMFIIRGLPMGLFDKLKEPVFLKDDSDAERQLAALRELREQAPGELADKIDEEINRVNAGIWGEQTVRFELENSHLPMYILHDLFLEYDGLTAQIDYLIVTRKQTFVIECKNLYGDIEINSAGDFVRTTTYGRHRKKEGIYSPITQNRRHLELIKQIRSASKGNFLTKALFEKYFDENYRSIVVLANPKTVLYDRYAKKEVRQQVIRADQLADYIRKSNAASKNESYSDAEMEALARFFLGINKEQKTDFTAKFREELTPQAQPITAPAEPVPQALPPEEAAITEKKQLLCPKCGGVMVKRKATKGPNAGKEFYGCSNYPRCRCIINIQ